MVRGTRTARQKLILMERWVKVAVIVSLGWQVWDHIQGPRPAPPPVSTASTSSASPGQAVQLAADERGTVELFKRVSPSVVYIATANVRRDFFTLNLQQIPRGTGSGFIWDKKGHIVTNFHVVQGADEVEVVLTDQSRWPAKVIGAEPDKDLAVIKVEAPQKDLRAIEVGNSSRLEVGQKVFAIGNPFGLDQTLTTGVISGLGREIESITRRPIQGVIQTDAAINPGNSGGPLLDSGGRLIGVNTSIYSPSGAYAGIGFAVPADIVHRLIPQLIEYGRIQKPGLGISIAPDRFTAGYQIEGVLILQVLSDGPADKAGLLPTRRDASGHIVLGDVIVALNGKPVRNSNDLFVLLDGLEVGQKVKLRVRRDERELEVEVELSALSG